MSLENYCSVNSKGNPGNRGLPISIVCQGFGLISGKSTVSPFSDGFSKLFHFRYLCDGHASLHICEVIF